MLKIGFGIALADRSVRNLRRGTDAKPNAEGEARFDPMLRREGRKDAKRLNMDPVLLENLPKASRDR